MRLLIIAFVLLGSYNANAATFVAKPIPFSDSLVNNNYNKLSLLSNTSVVQLENYLGRKLKFKEKIALRVLKFKLKNSKNTYEDVNSKQGKTSLTLGILALVFLFLFPIATIPLGILAITNGDKAIQKNPNDKDGKTGKTLGIISLAVLAVAILALIALIRAFVVY